MFINKKKLLVLLTTGSVLMFAFGWALVPLYDLFCEVTGLGGRTNQEQYVATDKDVLNIGEEVRQIDVTFVAINSRGPLWEFQPKYERINVTLGELVENPYIAKSFREDIVVKAIPSVTPGRAAEYMKKVKCFCWETQQLYADKTIEMPLRFILLKTLPKEIENVTLLYSLYEQEKSDVTAGGK